MSRVELHSAFVPAALSARPFSSRAVVVCHAASAPAPDAEALLKQSDTIATAGQPTYSTSRSPTSSPASPTKNALRGLAERHGQDLRRVHEPPRKRPAPAHARRRHVGLSARYQPARAHHSPRTALRRRLQRRRRPHQLRRRLHARLICAPKKSAHESATCSTSPPNAKAQPISGFSTGCASRMRDRSSGVLPDVRQAHQVRDLRRISRVRTASCCCAN